ncbi:MAG TPA: hypothetical protein VFY16_05225, partial [Gemmatimonadaceae bacterium]|nr:hypothetical protein [Gemmatimonadaceae bacterium]
MLSLDDPRWRTLHGGYRQPYDPTPVLRGLATEWADEQAWEELWAELHHQGDVGEASYAALTVIADLARRVPARGWSVYALATTIETERHARRNPPLPGWLADDYARAWATLLELALADLRAAVDPLVVRSALAVVALARGATKLGALIGWLDESEIDEYLDEH